MPSKERLALLWHCAELLLVVSVVGLGWSVYHEQRRWSVTNRQRALNGKVQDGINAITVNTSKTWTQ
jgi:hypothetical protein